MFKEEESLVLLLLKMRRFKQLKTIRMLENTTRELCEIEEELKVKLHKVKKEEEKALNEIMRQVAILEKINTNINLFSIEDEQDNIMKQKSNFPLKNISKRYLDD